jgi:hypothetical protein
MTGRTITQAVSRRLPTAAARVRAQVMTCWICGGQSGTGAGFIRVLRFPLPTLIPPTAPCSSSIIRSWFNKPTYKVDSVSSHPKKKKRSMTDVLYGKGWLNLPVKRIATECMGIEGDGTKISFKSTIFWDIAPCSPLRVNRGFGETYRFHLQGWISWVR